MAAKYWFMISDTLIGGSRQLAAESLEEAQFLLSREKN